MQKKISCCSRTMSVFIFRGSLTFVHFSWKFHHSSLSSSTPSRAFIRRKFTPIRVLYMCKEKKYEKIKPRQLRTFVISSFHFSRHEKFFFSFFIHSIFFSFAFHNFFECRDYESRASPKQLIWLVLKQEGKFDVKNFLRASWNFYASYVLCAFDDDDTEHSRTRKKSENYTHSHELYHRAIRNLSISKSHHA